MDFLLGIDLVALVQTVGLLGLFFIVFAESGLLLGFFLPGDSLLFTAGFLASQGFANIWLLIADCFAAAVLGDNVGYAFGRRVGPAIFKREQSLLFNPKNLERARTFYEAYGGMAILARWLPAIRTFAPILAGVGTMHYRSFVFFNIIGALFWAIGMPLLGYFLGSIIPDPDRYLVPIVLLIIFLSFLPPGIGYLRDRERRRWLWHFIRANPVARRTIGVALIIIGIAAIFIPFFPFAWVAFVGLQFLGLRFMFLQRIRGWWRRNGGATHKEIADHADHR